MASRWWAAVVVVVALGVVGTGASDVVQLTSGNFESTVLQSKDYWLVEFYAPWCGHCKNLAPTWEELATEVKAVARIGAIDATAHKDIASQYGIQGFPTIKEFGSDKQAPVDYRGGRDLSALKTYVQQQAKAFKPPAAKVQKVKYRDMHDFVAGAQASKRPSFLLLAKPATAGSKAPKWFAALVGKAKAKIDTLAFAFASGAQGKKIRSRLGIESGARAAIVAFWPQGTFSSTGIKSAKEAAAFVRSAIKGGNAQGDGAEAVPAFPEPSRPKARSPVKLTTLSALNLERKCLKAKGMCVLVFGDASTHLASIARPLAKTFRLDAFNFGFVPHDTDLSAHLWRTVTASLGEQAPVDPPSASQPHVVVLKTGRRKRLAMLPTTSAADAVPAAEAFLNSVVGGSTRFTKLADLDLEALAPLPADAEGEEEL